MVIDNMFMIRYTDYIKKTENKIDGNKLPNCLVKKFRKNKLLYIINTYYTYLLFDIYYAGHGSILHLKQNLCFMVTYILGSL